MTHSRLIRVIERIEKRILHVISQINNALIFSLIAAFVVILSAGIYFYTNPEKFYGIIMNYVFDKIESHQNIVVQRKTMDIKYDKKSKRFLATVENIKFFDHDQEVFALKNLQIAVSTIDLLKLHLRPYIILKNQDFFINKLTFQGDNTNFIDAIWNIVDKYEQYFTDINIILQGVKIHNLQQIFQINNLKISFDEAKNKHELSIQTDDIGSIHGNLTAHCTLNQENISCSSDAKKINGLSGILKEIIPIEMDLIQFNGNVKINRQGIELFEFTSENSNSTLKFEKWIKNPIKCENLSINGLKNDGIIEFNAQCHSLDGKSGQYIGAKIIKHNNNLQITADGKNLETIHIDRYWSPNHLTSLNLWLKNAIPSGTITKADATIIVDENILKTLNIKAIFKDVTFAYSKNFPALTNADGNISISNIGTNIEIGITKARNLSTEIQNSKAHYDVTTDILKLYLNTKNIAGSILEIFKSDDTSSQELLNSAFHGYITARTEIELNTKNPLDSLSYSSSASISEFSPFGIPNSIQDAKTTLTVTKNKSENITTITILTDINSGTESIKEIIVNAIIDPKNNAYKIQNFVVKNLNDKSITDGNLDFKSSNLDIGFLFGKNDFRIKNSQTDLNIRGKSLDLGSFYRYLKLLYKTKTQNTKPEQTNDTTSEKSITVDLKKLKLLNGDEVNNLLITKNKLNDISISSDTLNVKITDDVILLKAQNLGSLLFGLFDAQNLKSVNGAINIGGKRIADRQNIIAGDILITDYAIPIGQNIVEFDKLFGQFEYNKISKIITLKNIKTHNKLHTIFLNGTINIKTKQIDIDILYTSSAIEFANTVPILKEAIVLATLGQNKNGIVTLNYKIQGDLFAPQISFNRADTAKKASKTLLAIMAGHAFLWPLLLVAL